MGRSPYFLPTCLAAPARNSEEERQRTLSSDAHGHQRLRIVRLQEMPVRCLLEPSCSLASLVRKILQV